MSSTSLSSRPSSDINTVHETKFVVIYVPIIIPAEQATSNGIRIDDVLKMNASVLKSPLVKNQVINALNQTDLIPPAGPNKYGFELSLENEEHKGCKEDNVDAVVGLDAAEGINLSIDSGPLSVPNKQCVKHGSSESTTFPSLENKYCSYLLCTSRSLVQPQLVLQRSQHQPSILSTSSPSSDTQYCFDDPLHLPQPCVPSGSIRLFISSSSNQWVNWNPGVWQSNWTVQPWCVRERFEGGFQCSSFSGSKYCSSCGLQHHHQRSLQPCEMRSSEISVNNMPRFAHTKFCERLSCCIHRNITQEMASFKLEGRLFNGSLPVQKFSKISQHENKWYFAKRVCSSGAKALHTEAPEAAAALAA